MTERPTLPAVTFTVPKGMRQFALYIDGLLIVEAKINADDTCTISHRPAGGGGRLLPEGAGGGGAR